MKSIILFLYLITYSLNLYIPKLYRNEKKKLSTDTSDTQKYFYMDTSNYASYSTIYLCLEDSNFGLKTSSFEYCYTNINPSDYPTQAIQCTFSYKSSYGTKTSSSTTKVYYSFTTYSTKNYIIVHYDGTSSSGTLYAISDYTDLFFEAAAEVLSTIIIVFIVIGCVVFLAIIIIISVCCCACSACCRNNQPTTIPIPQQPNYIMPNPVTYPLVQPVNNYGAPIPQQPTPVGYNNAY